MKPNTLNPVPTRVTICFNFVVTNLLAPQDKLHARGKGFGEVTWYWSPMDVPQLAHNELTSRLKHLFFSQISWGTILANYFHRHRVLQTWGRYVSQPDFFHMDLSDPWLDSSPLSDPWSWIHNALEIYISLKNNIFMQEGFVIIKTWGLNFV